LSKIHFDIEDRKNKYPSPICFFVQIASDFRILYKRESPYFDLQGCFHETAMHASSVDANNEYWDKFRISMGIAEVFSTFFERLTKNNNYISLLLDSDKDNNIFDKLTSRNRLWNYFLSLLHYKFINEARILEKELFNRSGM
jgi:hypothetical protein